MLPGVYCTVLTSPPLVRVRMVCVGVCAFGTNRKCGPCGKTKAGGAYNLNTSQALTVRSSIRRLRDMVDK